MNTQNNALSETTHRIAPGEEEDVYPPTPGASKSPPYETSSGETKGAEEDDIEKS